MEIHLIVWLQQNLPTQTFAFFAALSDMGGIPTSLAVWGIVSWYYSRRMGFILIQVSLLGYLATSVILKPLIGTPRPFVVFEAIAPLVVALGNAMPSGHAFNAMLLWGSVAMLTRERWIRYSLALLIVGIGLSRVVLGVHYPSDIAVGWALGAVALWGLRWWHNKPRLGTVTLGASLLLLAASIAALIFLVDRNDTAWLQAILCAWAGATIGYGLTRSLPQQPHNLLLCLLALGLLVLIHFALPLGPLGFGVACLWVTGGAPWLLHRFARRTATP